MKNFKSYLLESENIHGFISTDEAIQYVLENCQQWFLEIYRHEIKTKEQLDVLLDKGYYLFRGKKNSPRNFIEIASKNRRPRNSSTVIHEVMNKALTKLGFNVHRGNSLFCTNNESIANYYGKLYYVFPVDGYEYLYSKKITDLFTLFNNVQDFYALSDRNVGVSPLFPNLQPYLEKMFKDKMNIPQRDMFNEFLSKYSVDELLEIFKIDEKVLQELYDFTNIGVGSYITTKLRHEYIIEILIRSKIVLLEVEE